MKNALSSLLIKLRNNEPLRDVATRAGISHTYLSQLEVGSDKRTGKEIRPSADILQRLAKAYNYPYEELLIVAGYIENSNDLTPTPKEEHLTFYRKVGQLSPESLAILEQQADHLLELEKKIIERKKVEHENNK